MDDAKRWAWHNAMIPQHWWPRTIIVPMVLQLDRDSVLTYHN